MTRTVTAHLNGLDEMFSGVYNVGEKVVSVVGMLISLCVPHSSVNTE